MFSAWSDRGRCFSSSGEWCLSEHLSVVSEGMGFSETICSVSNVQCLVWSGRCFLLLVNGVYQSIYQLFRREWASQKRSVVCLMFSAWSDRGRCFSSSGEWCLSEHLSVVSEGMGFSETICSVSNVQCLVWSGQMFFSSGEWCLSEHLSVVSEGMGFSETICSVSNVQCLVWSGQMFFFFRWMVSIRASISCFGGNGLLRNDLWCLMFLVWSGQMFFFFWWMVSIRASISCFGGNGLLRNDL